MSKTPMTSDQLAREREGRATLVVNATLVWRRARTDLGLLLAMLALVATAAMLASAGPRLVLQTVDGGAAQIVSQAGDATDVQLSFQVASGPKALSTAQQVPDNLPPRLSQVVSDLQLSVTGGEGSVKTVDGAPGDAELDQGANFALATPALVDGVRVVEGHLPAKQGPDVPIEVAISPATAELTSFTIGTTFSLRLKDRAPVAEGMNPHDPQFIVVGIIEPAPGTPASAPLWKDEPQLWAPDSRDATAASVPSTRFTAVVAEDALETIAHATTLPFVGLIRLHVDPQRFTADRVPGVINELTELASKSATLTDGAAGPAFDVQTQLGEVLASYPPQARAALAQMSILTAGVLGIASVVVLLLARLLALHRQAALALERARGSSVRAVGGRALIESTVITATGMIIGLGAALVAVPGGLRDAFPLTVLALVALCAVPVQSMLMVRSLWTGRREPANRRDRAQLARRRASIRVVIELSIVLLAAAAIFSLRQRGLLQTRTDGIDPFLAAAPVLLAFALSIVVLRIFPVPVRAVSSIGRRSRGALGLLGAVRARAAIATLPLLALTLGASVAVTGGLLVDTVRTGQVEASWERVGADARIDVGLSAAESAQLRASPDLTAVASAIIRSSVGFDFGTTKGDVTVIAVDEHFADVVDTTPGAVSTDIIRALAAQPMTGDSISVVVDESVASRLVSPDIAMYYGPRFLTLHVIGVTGFAPVGYATGPFAYVDLATVLAALPEPVAPTTTLIAGPGAEAAVASLGLGDGEATTRTEWIAQRRARALVSGVETVMLAAAVTAALLAIVALAATVIAGARARGRALSMLRTLGMPSGLGWWLALAELAPLVIASVVGGIAAGVIIVVALAPAIGLDVLAGGVGLPSTSIDPIVIVSVVVGGVLLLGIGALVEVLAHRRDKLSDVLRVGDSA